MKKHILSALDEVYAEIIQNNPENIDSDKNIQEILSMIDDLQNKIQEVLK